MRSLGDASMRSLGNGASIFFGTFPSPRGLLMGYCFYQAGPELQTLRAAVRVQFKGAANFAFSRDLTYRFVVHLRALQEPEPLPLAQRLTTTEAVPIHIPVMSEANLARSSFRSSVLAAFRVSEPSPKTWPTTSSLILTT
jgi:hypothetical protein